MAWQRESLADLVEKHGCAAADTPVTRRVKAMIREDYERAEKRHPRRPGLHVSHANKCPQQVYFDLTGAEKTEPISDESLVNFKFGRVGEEMMAKLLAQGGKLIRETEVLIPFESIGVSGHIDFLIAFPDQREMWELKTTKTSQMTWMVKRNEQGQDDHRHQLNLYLHASRLGLMEHVYERGHLVYLVKDATVDQPVVFDFVVEYDEFMALGDLNAMLYLDRLAADGTPPGIPYEFLEQHRKKGVPPYFPCDKFCQYRRHCWGEHGNPIIADPSIAASA